MKTIQTLKYVLASALVSVLFALPVSADQTVTEQGQVEQVQTGMIDINNAKIGPNQSKIPKITNNEKTISGSSNPCRHACFPNRRIGKKEG